MTDYPTKASGWRKREVAAKWRNLLAIFITSILVLAILNGFLRAFSFKNYLDSSQLDDSSTIFAINSEPPAVLIYQKEPKQIVAISLDNESYFATGDPNEPIKTVASIVDLGDGQKLTKMMSRLFGADIENFMILKSPTEFNEPILKKAFTKFASPLTPFLILKDSNIGNTNITRIDQIRLWWQLKSLSVNQLKLVDFSTKSSEIVVSDEVRVKAVDSDLLHQEIIKYTQNPKITASNPMLEILNASGLAAAGDLSGKISESFGYRVIKIERSEAEGGKCRVFSSNKDYSVRYLASKLKCDIVLLPKDENTLRLVIGEDFERHYFE